MAQNHFHQGYYFSVSGGYAGGNIKIQNSETLKLTGPAFGMHVLLGFSMRENLYLHLSYTAKTMHPDVNGRPDDSYHTVDEVLRGLGVTYYLRNNFFVSGNAGLGKFFITDKVKGNRYDTDNGFSFNAMGGKEWWISSRFALGLVLEYGLTFLEDSRDNTEWSTQRFSVRLTFSVSRPTIQKG